MNQRALQAQSADNSLAFRQGVEQERRAPGVALLPLCGVENQSLRAIADRLKLGIQFPFYMIDTVGKSSF